MKSAKPIRFPVAPTAIAPVPTADAICAARAAGPVPYGEEMLIRVTALASSPRMPAPCHDCAFAEGGSAEQRDRKVWFTILRHVDRGEPFFCHAGMPVARDGRYSPKLDAHGFPEGARVCAGWVAMRRQFLDVRRRDLADELRAVPAEYPEAFAVARLADGRPA